MKTPSVYLMSECYCDESLQTETKTEEFLICMNEACMASLRFHATTITHQILH